MIPGLPSPWLILATVLALLGAFATGDLYRGRQDKIAYDGAIAALQRDAAADLVKATNETRAKEAAAAALADKVETDHADAEKKFAAVVADYDAQLRGKRLRDKAGIGASCPSPGSAAGDGAASSAGPAAATGCSLSDSASDGLRRIALEADAFRLYAVACHDWAIGLGR